MTISSSDSKGDSSGLPTRQQHRQDHHPIYSFRWQYTRLLPEHLHASFRRDIVAGLSPSSPTTRRQSSGETPAFPFNERAPYWNPYRAAKTSKNLLFITSPRFCDSYSGWPLTLTTHDAASTLWRHHRTSLQQESSLLDPRQRQEPSFHHHGVCGRTNRGSGALTGTAQYSFRAGNFSG